MGNNIARLLQWTFIVLLLSVGSGMYFWYGGKAGVSVDTPSITDAAVTSGLIAHYTFDPPDVVWSDPISEIKDHTGNGHYFNAVNLSEPNLGPGHIGQALNFTPGNSTSLVKTEAAFDALATGSISMWIKWDGTSTGSSGTLFDRGDCGSNNGQFQLYMDMSASTIGLWITAVSAGCSATVDAETTIAISDPKAWHHIVFTDSSSGHVVYIDGSPQTLSYASGNSSVDFFFDNVGGSQEYQIGRNSSEEFGGLMDDIRVYNRALSASEVYQLYTMGTNTINAPLEDSLSTSMRGYWKMDTGSGTSAVDASGNANTLAMTGSPSWVTGNIGPSALDFSGSGQYLSVADPSSGVLDMADGASFTLTGWFNRDTFTADHTIVAKKNSQSTNTDDGYIVWVDDADDLIHFRADENGSTDSYTMASSTAFTATGWHHFAISWNDSVGMNIYVDGANNNGTASGTFANVGTLANSVAFAIGAESDGGNPFDGKLDDIRVYGNALSAEEVKKLYNTTAPTEPVDTSLVGHWTFDGMDVKGTTAIDKSGHGNDGAITGATKTIGKLGQGLSFDGGGDYVCMGDVLAFERTDPFSLSAWVHLATDSDVDGSIIGKMGPTPDQRGYDIYASTASWKANIRNSDSGSNGITVNGLSDIADETWHHIAVTYDGSSSASGVTLYVDGADDTGTTDMDTLSATIVSSADFSMGTRNCTPSPIFDVKGVIDDVRIYSRALTQAEVYQLSTAGVATVNAPVEDPLSQGLLSYWKMDEGTGTSTTADASGNATTLTMTVMESGDWTTGQIGPYSLDFDGAAEYLTVADPAILDFVDGASFSLTGWFNRSRTFDTDDTIIAKKTDQSTNAGYTVWIDNNGTADTLCLNAYGTAGYTRCSTAEINAAGWHHFAVSWEDDRGVDIYIDGALSNGTDPGGFSSVASLANANAFRIGAESGTADNFFDGNIDDVRVYGFPLSAGDVLKLYQTTAPAQPVDTGLVGHWTFDGPDIAGTTAIDRSSFGNNGTITGAVPTIGKLGQGMGFDGSGDYVGLASSIIGTGTYTLCTWINNPAFNDYFPLGNVYPFWFGIWSLSDYNLTQVFISNNDTGTIAASAIIPDNVWHFVCGIRYANNTATFFVDGIQSGSANQSAGTISSTSGNFLIGAQNGGSKKFSGKMDDFRIYDRALTASEIVNLYNLGK